MPSLLTQTHTHTRREKKTTPFVCIALDSWAQIKSKQMTSYFFCHISFIVSICCNANDESRLTNRKPSHRFSVTVYNTVIRCGSIRSSSYGNWMAMRVWHVSSHFNRVTFRNSSRSHSIKVLSLSICLHFSPSFTQILLFLENTHRLIDSIC